MASGSVRPVSWAIDKKSTAGFALALVLLVAVGICSQLDTLRLTQISHWVVHSDDVLRGVEAGVASLRQTEASQRAYLLAGDRAALHDYQAAEARTRRAFQRLQSMTADRPEQQRRVEALQPWLQKKLALLKDEAQRGPAALAGHSAEDHEASRQIDALTSDLRDAEAKLLEERTRLFRESADSTNRFVEWANLFALVLVTLGLLLINRSAARRRNAEEALQRAHDDLEIRVVDRTQQLASVNTALAAEVEQRQQAQEKLAQLAAIVQSSDDAILSMNLEGVIDTWNGGAERLYGYAASEVLGRSAGVLVPPDAVDELPGVLVKIKRCEPVPGYEAVRVCKFGRRADVWTTVSPIRDGTGAIVGVSSVTRDISDRKRLEAQYRQAQKMEAIGRLAGGVAHDFNNLLTVITCADDMLLRRLSLDTSSRELLEQSKRAAERATSLTRQLLAFSRQQVLVNKVIDVNALVRDMEKMLRRLIGEDVELLTELDPAVHAIKADPSQIEQVLMNLAVNARDAMPRGGRLRIDTANVQLDATYAQARPEVRPGPYAMICVSDTGCGMDAATRARVFEPFFTTKEPGKGTGLGLATVYGIVKQSNGYVYLQSELGRGTTFKVYFPKSETPAAIPLAPDTDHGADGSGNETILLAEDEDEVRVVTMQILQRAGYQVLEVSNGRQALETAERHVGPIHLLLSDVVMPKMSGRELADAMVRLRSETKVLFLSGYTDDAVMRHGVLSGDAEFLHKPFDPNTLLRKVRDVLDKGSKAARSGSTEEEVSVRIEPGELGLSRLVALSVEPRRRSAELSPLPDELVAAVGDPRQ